MTPLIFFFKLRPYFQLRLIWTIQCTLHVRQPHHLNINFRLSFRNIWTYAICNTSIVLCMMDQENLFSRLRRLANKVENESNLFQERMQKPPDQRVASDATANNILKEMQYDVHRLKVTNNTTLLILGLYFKLGYAKPKFNLIICVRLSPRQGHSLYYA